jgi:hypothetical protein
MDFELRVPITTIFKAQRFVFVIAQCESCWCKLQVAPRIARRVLCAINSDERTETVVCVLTKRERPSLQNAEGDANVKSNVELCTIDAHRLIRQLAGAPQGAMAVTNRLR